MSGTPSSKKGTGTPTSVDVNTYINPTQMGQIDTYNLFGYLAQLDNDFFSGIINTLKTNGNIEGANTILKRFGLPNITK
jgi:hypothetical protein